MKRTATNSNTTFNKVIVDDNALSKEEIPCCSNKSATAAPNFNVKTQKSSCMHDGRFISATAQIPNIPTVLLTNTILPITPL